MDTLPLPPRPDLAQYRKRAKELVSAARSADPGAIRAWATAWLAELAGLLEVEITPFVQASFDRAVGTLEARVRDALAARPGSRRFALADAQFLIARAHGFASWSHFAGHVDRAAPGSFAASTFESAADAVVGGDLPALERVLSQDPALIGARSEREHRATLLHYVAANGVEDFRQKTPPNAVAIARLVLAAGAEVDALAETYGGGPAQTTMNLLVSSVHPAAAGLQPALVETLLDFGAAVDGLEDNGSPLMTALGFGYPEAAEALVRRGARVDNLYAAAALGDLELVRTFDERAVAGPLVGLDWLGLGDDPRAQRERALIAAAAFGRTEVVHFLLQRNVDRAAVDPGGMTALHWAAGNGYLGTARLLLERGAPLETKNASGETVLGSTVRFAAQNPGDFGHYSAVIQALIAAGADVGAAPRPTGDERLDALLGARDPERGLDLGGARDRPRR